MPFRRFLKVRIMKTKLIHLEKGLRTYAVTLEKREPVLENLLKFSRKYHLSASSVKGTGELDKISLRFPNGRAEDYKENVSFEERMEVLSFEGNIVVDEGRPQLDAKVIVALSNGNVHGGCLLEAQAHPAIEVLIEELPVYLRRSLDPRTGLSFIAL